MWTRVTGWYLTLAVAVALGWWALAERAWGAGRRQRGQGMVEYAVLVALIVIVAMGAIQYFGQGVTTVFKNVVARITSIG